jgi:hypothetical protein
LKVPEMKREPAHVINKSPFLIAVHGSNLWSQLVTGECSLSIHAEHLYVGTCKLILTNVKSHSLPQFNLSTSCTSHDSWVLSREHENGPSPVSRWSNTRRNLSNATVGFHPHKPWPKSLGCQTTFTSTQFQRFWSNRVVVFIWLPVILHSFAMVFRTELIMKLLFWILKSVVLYEGELE